MTAKLYTMSIVDADGTETIIYGHATINVIEDFIGAYADNLDARAFVKVVRYFENEVN